MQSRPRETAPPVVHPTAVVLPGAELGPGVEVGPYAVIEPGVELGADCVVGPHAHLLGRLTVGPRTHVGTGSVLGGPPQDDAWDGGRGLVRIGADVRIHEHVTVHRPSDSGADHVTEVGDGARLMAGSHVGHQARLGAGAVLVNGACLAGHSELGPSAILSGNAAVHQHGRVGRLCMVGGGAMVTLDAPPFAIVTGGHPPTFHGVNVVGLRRAGVSDEARRALRRAFRDLYANGVADRAVAERLAADEVAEVAEVGRFVLASRRGVCPRAGRPR